jgi:lysophospholipase L1-like esterase
MSGVYDGVIDFDAVVRDPAQPTRMRAEFDSGDTLHPSDAGYEAMGEAIDLALFRRTLH